MPKLNSLNILTKLHYLINTILFHAIMLRYFKKCCYYFEKLVPLVLGGSVDLYWTAVRKPSDVGLQWLLSYSISARLYEST